MIETKVCNCGGEYIYKDGKWVCDFCGRAMNRDAHCKFCGTTKVCTCGGEYIYEDGKWVCDLCGRAMNRDAHCK